jgi:hypothetical protein
VVPNVGMNTKSMVSGLSPKVPSGSQRRNEYKINGFRVDPRGSEWLPAVPRGSQRLPEGPSGSQKLPEAPRNSQRLPEIA